MLIVAAKMAHCFELRVAACIECRQYTAFARSSVAYYQARRMRPSPSTDLVLPPWSDRQGFVHSRKKAVSGSINSSSWSSHSRDSAWHL